MKTSEQRFNQVIKKGTRHKLVSDFYHTLLLMSWTRFFLFYVVLFLGFNLSFAMIYWIVPGSLNGTNQSLFHAFAFSVQRSDI